MDQLVNDFIHKYDIFSFTSITAPSFVLVETKDDGDNVIPVDIKQEHYKALIVSFNMASYSRSFLRFVLTPATLDLYFARFKKHLWIIELPPAYTPGYQRDVPRPAAAAGNKVPRYDGDVRQFVLFNWDFVPQAGAARTPYSFNKVDIVGLFHTIQRSVCISLEGAAMLKYDHDVFTLDRWTKQRYVDDQQYLADQQAKAVAEADIIKLQRYVVMKGLFCIRPFSSTPSEPVFHTAPFVAAAASAETKGDDEEEDRGEEEGEQDEGEQDEDDKEEVDAAMTGTSVSSQTKQIAAKDITVITSGSDDDEDGEAASGRVNAAAAASSSSSSAARSESNKRKKRMTASEKVDAVSAKNVAAQLRDARCQSRAHCSRIASRAAGQMFDCLDSCGDWLVAVSIAPLQEGSVMVHFPGWV